MKVLWSLLFFGAGTVLSAYLPKDAVWFEAEDMKTDDSGAWKIIGHNSWFPSRPSKGKLLCGQTEAAGKAVFTTELKKKGKYYLHIRYLDPLEGSAPYELAAKQKWEVLRKELGSYSLRSYPAMLQKFGEGRAQYVWETLEFDGRPGKLTVTLEKKESKKGSWLARIVDCFILTQDAKYTPAMVDQNPLFVRIRALPDNPDPFVVHVWGNSYGDKNGYYFSHINMTRLKNLYVLLDTAFRNGMMLKSGDVTPWLEISRQMTWIGINRFYFTAEKAKDTPADGAAYEIEFSRTPNEKGIFRKDVRTGPGCTAYYRADVAGNTLQSDLEGSEQSLRFAKATEDIPGRRPVKFPVVTGLHLSRTARPEVIAREEEAQALIGINGGHYAPEKGFFYTHTFSPVIGLVKDFCLAQPKIESVERILKRAANLPENTLFYNVQDEPGFSFGHVDTCLYCGGKYEEFLKKHGKSGLELTADFKKKESRYWSMRYSAHVFIEWLRTMSGIIKKYNSKVPATVNFSIGVTSTCNLVASGGDWFEIFRSGALGYGWTEDYGGYNRTLQIRGYAADVMRAACRPLKIQHGVFLILGQKEQIVPMAYAEVGRGTNCLHFFEYGPSYAMVNETHNQFPEVFRYIRQITYPLGAVEDLIVGGTVAKGDAAQLFSTTNDYMEVKRDNEFGAERMELNLLLRHSNIRPDILNEEDILTELPKYKTLFVSDCWLRREFFEPLMDWVRKGGTMYLTAGALRFDECGKKLELPIVREDYVKTGTVGRSGFEMTYLKSVDTVQGIPVAGGYQKPYMSSTDVGAGKIVNLGFFPGIAHIVTSKKEGNYVRFTPEGETLMKSLLTGRLRTDNDRLEAHLIENTPGDVIVLSNWTGAGIAPAVIELDNAPEYKSVKMIRGKIIAQERNGGTLTIRAEVPEGGDYIECLK